MAIYKVKTPLNHNGEVYEPGAEVELSEAEARPLLPDVVEALHTDKPSTTKKEEPKPESDFEDSSYRELQEEAKRRGLPAKGSKDELMERLAADDAKNAEPTLPESPATDEAEDDEDPGADL